MHDIILGHIAKLRAEDGQRAVVILPVIEHLAVVGWTQPVEGIHQRRFTRAGAADEGHELAWGNDNRDVVQQDDVVIASFPKPRGIDTDAAAFIVRRQFRACIGELVGPDAYLIAGIEQFAGYALSVDIDVVGAAEIDDAIPALHLFQTRVMTRNLGMGENYGVIPVASNGDDGRVERDWTHLGRRFLDRAGTIVKGEGDKCAIFVAYAKDIAAR